MVRLRLFCHMVSFSVEILRQPSEKLLFKKHWIKGIVSLPANLLYGTGIAACVLVIDKEGAANRQGIFMIDASRGSVKDGNKNRLRERDIYRIITVFNEQITTDSKSD